jgi:uncharacterized membrane protein HdeD (DUF308 family)
MNEINTINTEIEQMQQKLLIFLQEHWRIFLAEGIIFILLGLSAIVIPQLFTIAIVIFLGWIIVMGGVIQVSRALFFPDMPGFGLWLGIGILQVLIGYLLIADPVAGVLTLTMMMTLFFAFEGIIKISLALMMRPMPHWNFVLFSGITALIFAVLILVFWSETAHWLLGLFLGINMIMLGVSMIKMCLRYRESH